ncbi:hypothetical protein ACU8V6_00380 [Vibrio alginolyticus]
MRPMERAVAGGHDQGVDAAEQVQGIGGDAIDSSKARELPRALILTRDQRDDAHRHIVRLLDIEVARMISSA